MHSHKTISETQEPLHHHQTWNMFILTHNGYHLASSNPIIILIMIHFWIETEEQNLIL